LTLFLQKILCMSKSFYVTTPIYYPNGIPHVGTAYTTIAADILTRWHRMKDGGNAFLLTGTDEHGQKVEQAAVAKGMPVQAYVDEIAVTFKEAWEALDIWYDDFIRTTESRHVQTVLKFFRKLMDKRDIYKNYYEGWYCVSCETFWMESQLVDGKCPNSECGRPVEWLKEEDYFFKLSTFQERLLQHYEKNPGFVRPESRMNEVTSFVKSGLQDVCVSRKGLGWGIPVPEDTERSIYVWIDALLNYLSAIGYLEDSPQFKKLWPANVHLVGKDILRFHAVIWPAMLMALDLPLPKKVFANGWLTMGGSKISKSRGVHRNLMELVTEYGPDPLRYFLMREASFGLDLDFSEEGIIRRLNTDLANDLGNLVQRVLSMIHRYFNGKVPNPGTLEVGDTSLRQLAQKLPEAIDSQLEELRFREALEAIFAVVVASNKYVDETAPWKLAKEKNETRLATVLYTLAEIIRMLAIALAPFLPRSADSIWKQLGREGLATRQTTEELVWGRTQAGTAIGTPTALFQKVEAPGIHS